MKRKQREKFSYGVAVGTVAVSSVATVGVLGLLALNKLQQHVRQAAEVAIDDKLYERKWKDVLDDLEDDECEFCKL